MIKFCIVKNGILHKTTNFLTLSTPHCTCRPILFPTRHYYNPSIWLMIRRVWLQFPPSFSHSVLKKNDMSIFAHSSPGYLVRAAESMISTPGQFSICLNRSELEWSCRCWNWEAQIFDFNNKIQKKVLPKRQTALRARGHVGGGRLASNDWFWEGWGWGWGGWWAQILCRLHRDRWHCVVSALETPQFILHAVHTFADAVKCIRSSLS